MTGACTGATARASHHPAWTQIMRARPESPNPPDVWRLLVAALAAAAFVPGAAYAGGDEPSGGDRPNKPPGPWSTEGGQGPYRASGTHRCNIAARPPGMRVRVLGLFVRRERCRRAVRLVEAYQQCRPEAGGRRCFRARKRCVQPPFLGRCRRYDRFYYRSVDGYRCIERRRYQVRSALRGERGVQARRPADRSQLHALHLTAGRGRAPSGSCARRGRTRACARSP